MRECVAQRSFMNWGIHMAEIDKARELEKIKKCLALSQSLNTYEA